MATPPDSIKGAEWTRTGEWAQVLDRQRHWGLVNVRDWGAYGDGVHDDTAAIQAALHDAVGKTCLVPAGTYLVSRAIVLPGNTTLVGAGRYAATIFAASGGDWAMPAPSTWVGVVGAVNADNVTIQHLGVNVNNETASGIVILGGDLPAVEDCYVANVAVHSGIHFFGVQAPGVNPVTHGSVRGNVVENAVYNFACDAQNQDCVVANNISIAPANTHFSLDGSRGGTGNHGITVFGNVAQGSQGGASTTFVVFDSGSINIVGNIAHNAIIGGQHFNIQGTSDLIASENILRTETAADYPAYGVMSGAVNNLDIQHNTFDGVGTAFYLIESANGGVSRYNGNIILNATTFQANNDPEASPPYETYYDMGANIFNGQPNHPAITPPASPLISGTVYQNTSGVPFTIYQPVYASTSGTAGSVAVALGASSTPSTLFTDYVPGDASSSAPKVVQLRVPPGWYYSFTTTGATLADATILGE